MTDWLRFAIDTGLFFLSCTVAFLLVFALDAWAQVRRTARTSPDAIAAPGRGRIAGRERKGLKPVVTA